MFLISGIFSAINAYLWNKWILKQLGNKGLVLLVPFIEEVSKTLIALMLRASILGAHCVFGVIEGIYDIKTSSKSIGKLAALASIVSHSFFGWVTYAVYSKTGFISVSILIAWVLHSSWNWYITKYI
ncbi:hypothetical protein [Alkaliphilus peptidifermentans]|uniref:CAAX protease self-immunity n=1 Tax=Alkaliphilus peptidifermentans DSM 18978 TaxID=1120976 RepID=A0A1G5ALA0_9FIRM|nr:hypothetical protein [Alkaliphilus peptidifermentans]SCX78625.1 hypothetical protein SAMN03080606_00186 [Alkaliphilus peptidifermentans DSM 18978]